jgi:hypothetical protein
MRCVSLCVVGVVMFKCMHELFGGWFVGRNGVN